MLSSIASAGPSAHRTQEGSGLLNNLFGTNHSDKEQGRSVPRKTAATNIGSGISNTAGEFRYESDLRLDSISLQSNWTRNYNNGQSRSGRANLNKQM